MHLRYACALSMQYCALGVHALRVSVHVPQMLYCAIPPPTDSVAQYLQYLHPLTLLRNSSTHLPYCAKAPPTDSIAQ